MAAALAKMAAVETPEVARVAEHQADQILDLKPVNIIVTSDLLTKIIDFGEAYHPKICK